MSQATYDLDPAVDGGTALDGALNAFRAALLSLHSGSSRPSYAIGGTLWLDTTGTPWLLKLYDGSDDITILSVNISTNAVAFSIADATISVAGLMSAADKTKLDGIAAGAEVNDEDVVTLTDAATVALNAADPNKVYLLTAVGNRTILAPSNPVSGKLIIIQHFASGAARTLALTTGAAGFRFGSDITALTQTASGKKDYIGAVYNLADDRWDIASYSKGF